MLAYTDLPKEYFKEQSVKVSNRRVCVSMALTVMDLNTRKEYFTATLTLGITLASNLAGGFIVGMVVAHLLCWEKLSV